MHPKNRYIVIAGVVVALFAIGIGGWMFYTREPAYTTETSSEIEGGASDFQYEKTSDGSRKHVEDASKYHIEAVYPDSVGIASSAGDSADDIARQTMELYVRQGITDFKEQDTEGAGLQKSLSLGYVRHESPHSVSFVFTVSADTGGAHPISYFKTFVWSKKGGELALADMLKGNYLQKISDLSKAQVRANIQKMMGEGGEVAIFEEGFAPSEENFQNFYVDGGELVILFDPYQVAAYAAGPQEVHIPLNNIKEFVRPEFLQG